MLAKKMRVGLLSPFLPEKDGIAIYSDNILAGLDKNKRFIVTIGRKGDKTNHIVKFRSFFLKEELEKIIKKEKLDLIHIQYVPTLFGKYNLNCNLIRALNLSVPTIVTLHEVHYSNKGLRNKIIRHIEKKIIKEANIIIVHTPKQKEFLKKRYKSNNIIMIYHGLNLYKAPKRKNNKNVLCFGMISTGKGVPYLIEAMDYLPSYNLTIAGKFVDEKAKKEVMDALKESKTKIKTEFDWIDEEKKADYYKEANIVVLPHLWAPYQSGILHNAVAWGLPVVATKSGALWEMVKKFNLGEIVKPKDPKALADGIKNVFKNYEYYQIGIDQYRKVANWSKIAEEHLKAYKAVKRKDFILSKPDVVGLRNKGYNLFDMHIHTDASNDCSVSLQSILNKAKKMGIGIAITDHDKIDSAVAAFNNKLGVPSIPGIEVFAKGDKHILFYFYDAKELTKFYNNEVKDKFLSKTANHLINLKNRYKCIVGVAHPCGWEMWHNLRINYDVKKIDFFEVLNGHGTKRRVLKSYSLALKYKKGMIGGSDAHKLNELGKSLTCIKEKTINGALDCIKNKETSVIGTTISLKEELKKLPKDILKFGMWILGKMYSYSGIKNIIENN